MTLKQKIATKDLLENVGKPISKAMADAGYSPATAKNPDHLTKSKGWGELMNQFLPDNKLLTKHQEALEATKIITSHTEPDYTVIDYPTVLKAVDLGYKLKGKYIENLGGNTTNILVIPSELMSKYGITQNTENSSSR